MSHSESLWLSWGALLAVLRGTDERPGIFQELFGVGLQTTSLKGVHLMNDVAQTLAGGAPSEGGDLLCRIVRHDRLRQPEDNSDPSLRFDLRVGQAYSRAFPIELGQDRILQLRQGARLLLNADGGMYQPKTRMASSLGTHVALLGFEGFRRFGLGKLVVALLDERGRERLRALLQQPTDPVSRTLQPLFQQGALHDTHPGELALRRCELDEALGAGLATLLSQPLSKPHLLRLFVLAASLGLLLKVHGRGSATGRPLLLATADRRPPPALRQAAASTLRRGVDALDHEVGLRLMQPGRLEQLALAATEGDSAKIPVPEGAGSPSLGAAIVRAARAHRPGKGEGVLVWPDECVVALGRRCGLLPKAQGGRSPYLRLSSELLEALVLMFVPEGSSLRWEELWSRVRAELGIVVGADTFEDRLALDQLGVLSVSSEHLDHNASQLLQGAVRRGVARHLPDSGAEVGGGSLDLR